MSISYFVTLLPSPIEAFLVKGGQKGGDTTLAFSANSSDVLPCVRLMALSSPLTWYLLAPLPEEKAVLVRNAPRSQRFLLFTIAYWGDTVLELLILSITCLFKLLIFRVLGKLYNEFFVPSKVNGGVCFVHTRNSNYTQIL